MFINDASIPRLFIHDNFDVIIHYEDKNTKQNFLRQVRNNFAQLLKANYKPPQILLILLSNEILDDTAFAMSQLQDMLMWLLAEIQTMIKTRISQLPEKCITPGEPWVYLLKPLPRTNRAPEVNLFKSIRRKINSQIPDIVKIFKFGFINAYDINTSSTLLLELNSQQQEWYTSGCQ